VLYKGSVVVLGKALSKSAQDAGTGMQNDARAW